MKSGQLARLLGLTAGMTVGDVGAGSGYHTVRLSRVVGPTGAVIAQDVSRQYLTQLVKRTERLELQNVKFALGEPHDPRLPRGSLDGAILVHMYHEIAEPYAFLYNLAPALRPDARIGIVDLDKPIAQHGTPPDLLRCELAAVGYREIAFHNLSGDAGYLAIFSPPKEAGPPATTCHRAVQSEARLNPTNTADWSATISRTWSPGLSRPQLGTDYQRRHPRPPQPRQPQPRQPYIRGR